MKLYLQKIHGMQPLRNLEWIHQTRHMAVANGTVVASIELAGSVAEHLRFIQSASAWTRSDIGKKLLICDSDADDVTDYLLINMERIVATVGGDSNAALRTTTLGMLAITRFLSGLTRYMSMQRSLDTSKSRIRALRRQFASDIAQYSVTIDMLPTHGDGTPRPFPPNIWRCRDRIATEAVHRDAIIAHMETLLSLMNDYLRRFIDAVDADATRLDTNIRRISLREFTRCVHRVPPVERIACTGDCCFCLAPLTDESHGDDAIPLVRLRTCDHVFHTHCLQRFLTRERVHQRCPICRAPISPIRPTSAVSLEGAARDMVLTLRSLGWSDDEDTRTTAEEEVTLRAIEEDARATADEEEGSTRCVDGEERSRCGAAAAASSAVSARAASAAHQGTHHARRAVVLAGDAVRLATIVQTRGPPRRFRLRT